jgi:hypothetical protein
VAVDIFRDKLRFYETGGTNRGFYLDVSSAGAAASTQLGTTFTYKVGDTGPGGGIIFFVDRHDEYAGFTYLEVAPVGVEVSNRQWAQSTPTNYTNTLVTGADSTALGGGYQNTLDIIAQGNTNAATCAARYCDTLVSGGQSDWYLPSLGELKLINEVVNVNKSLGGFTYLGDYYSSSETIYSSSAWGMTLPTGQMSTIGKDSTGVYIRPMRRFS